MTDATNTCPKCGKPWDEFHSAEATLMKVLTDKSILGLITGPKGAGKTFASVWLAWALVNFPHINWHVVSNIVFGKFKGMKNNQPQDDPESIPWYERHETPSKKIHLATTYAELFRVVSEVMLEAEAVGRRSHIMFIQDEAPVGGSGSKKMGAEKDIRKETMNALLTLARKIHMSVIMICLHERMVDTWYRHNPDEGGVGLVRVVFSKWENDIREIVEQSKREHTEGLREYAYDITDVPLNQLIAVKIIDDPTFRSSVIRVYPCTVAKPVSLLKIGDINYDSFGIADWKQGEIGGKKFTFSNLQDKVSDLIANDIPQVLYDYFHQGESEMTPEERKESEDIAEQVTPEQLDQLERQVKSDKDRPSGEKVSPKLLAVQAEINKDREHMNVHGGRPLYKTEEDLFEAANVSRPTFYRFKKDGMIDMSYRIRNIEEEEDAEDQNDV